MQQTRTLGWASVLAALLVVGCSPSLSASPTSSSGPPSPVSTPGFQAIPDSYTTPILDMRTDGHEIVWSRGSQDGDPSAAPDLWGFVPAGAEPREIFHNPNRDSVLPLVAVDAATYAWVETNIRTYGENGYRLWLLSGHQAPMLIDESDWQPGERTIPVPFMALGNGKLIWAAIHHAEAGLRFQLLAYDLSSQATTVLESTDATNTSIWFPSLDQDGKRLVYSTIEIVDGQDEFHVYLLDLTQGSRPLRLDRDGLATMPVISGDNIVWKSVRGNIFNASTLTRYSLASPTEVPSLVAELGAGLNYPSVGARYLTAWQDADSDVGLLDLVAGGRVSMDPVRPPAEEGRERATISGDLLIYLRADLSEQSKPLQLAWVELVSE